MKKFTLFVVVCMLTGVDAAAEIYKCTDAAGRVSYGDKPCKGRQIIFIPKAAPEESGDADSRRVNTQRLLNAFDQEHAEKKQEEAENKAVKETRAQHCQRARSRYQQASVAGRMYRVNEEGERIDFTDEERAGLLEKELAAIEKWCG